MKTLVRISAILSFTFCFLAGMCILSRTLFSSGHKDAFILTAIGLLFVGNAFFIGAILWLAAEKCRTQKEK